MARKYKQRDFKSKDQAVLEFWTHTDRDADCWNWIGSKNDAGYGKLWFTSKFWLAHRFSYTIHCGEIPAGLLVCHHCDNPSCVNPEHLFLGTQKDNMIDCGSKGRIRVGDRKGERHPLAKLTLGDVIVIKSQVGANQNELARNYGVSSRTINDIITGKNWKHVDAKTGATIHQQNLKAKTAATNNGRNGRQNGQAKV